MQIKTHVKKERNRQSLPHKFIAIALSITSFLVACFFKNVFTANMVKSGATWYTKVRKQRQRNAIVSLICFKGKGKRAKMFDEEKTCQTHKKIHHEKDHKKCGR